MRIQKVLAIIILALVGFEVSSFANPTGQSVVGGSASFNSSGSTLNVTTSDRAIINWRDFSINSGETTKFIQPNTTSAVLNRVTGSNPSNIYGTLQANGQVYLINSRGVLVGQNGVVNTAGFVASTLDTSNSDFMAKKDLLFSGNSTAKVSVVGKITASNGDVYLIAREVSNSGTITAANGNVDMGAGTQVLLKASGDDRLLIQPSSAAGSITNSGTIKAVASNLKAAGGNAYALAINNSGYIEATGAVNKNGRVILTSDGGNISNTGTIVAKNTGNKGGDVQITGKNITLAGTVDVSGKAAGGSVKAIAADTINFTGKINGQSVSGNGANAEVSGAHVSVSGTADLTSTNGTAGELLIDPGTVNIISSPLLFLAGPDVFSDAWIRNQLNFSSLTIRTSAATNGGPENIIVNSGVNITWNKPTKFELDAGKYIALNSGTVINSMSSFYNGRDAIVMKANVNGLSPTGPTYDPITITGATVASNTGNIVLFGQVPRGSGSSSTGVLIYNGGQVISYGRGSSAAKINITGIGQKGFDGGYFNCGVILNGGSISTVDGNVSVVGVGADSCSRYDNIGIWLNNFTGASQIVSTGRGSITLKGTALSGNEDAAGVRIDSNCKVSSSIGDINITGRGTGVDAVSNGLLLYGGKVESTGRANINICATSANPNVAGIFLYYYPSNLIGGPLDRGNITLKTNLLRVGAGSIQTRGRVAVNYVPSWYWF